MHHHVISYTVSKHARHPSREDISRGWLPHPIRRGVASSSYMFQLLFENALSMRFLVSRYVAMIVIHALYHRNEKKHSDEMQTLLAGCSLVRINARNFESTWLTAPPTPTHKQTWPITIHCTAPVTQCKNAHVQGYASIGVMTLDHFAIY